MTDRPLEGHRFGPKVSGPLPIVDRRERDLVSNTDFDVRMGLDRSAASLDNQRHQGDLRTGRPPVFTEEARRRWAEQREQAALDQAIARQIG